MDVKDVCSPAELFFFFWQTLVYLFLAWKKFIKDGLMFSEPLVVLLLHHSVYRLRCIPASRSVNTSVVSGGHDQHTTHTCMCLICFSTNTKGIACKRRECLFHRFYKCLRGMKDS